ncbi:unnamed protein product [Camellia sinensis]
MYIVFGCVLEGLGQLWRINRRFLYLHGVLIRRRGRVLILQPHGAGFCRSTHRFNDLVLKDQTVSANLCVIKQAKYADTFVAMLESRGMKGSVQVNGKIIKRGNICVINSGDEIFQLLVTDIVIKTPSSAGGAEVQATVGRLLHIERRVEDPSIMTGASILASLSSLRQDLSCLKPTAQASGKTHQGTKMPPHHIVHDSMEIDLDGLDANSETNIGSDKAGDIGETSKILSLDANPDSSIAAGNVFEERSEWTRDSLPASASGISLRRAVLKEDIYMGILDGKNMEVSFDSFPYYLSNEELVRQKDEVDVKVGDLQKELEGEWAKAVEERRGLQKESEAKRAKATAEKESLKKELEEERAKAASKRATLQKELDEERAKAASERVAYPDLCVVTVQQFKGSAEFKMAVDVAVASSLARQESGRAGPSRTTAGRRTEAEVIESFQQSDFYKHEMAEFWDSGWKMFKRRAEELFPDLDLSSVTIGEDDVAQTPLDEGIKEEDLISSEEEVTRCRRNSESHQMERTLAMLRLRCDCNSNGMTMTTHLIFLAILFELLVRRTSRMLTNILAEFALKEHNKKEKANLRLVRVVEASLSRSKGITYYNKTLRKLIHSNDAITYHIKLEAINDDDDSGETLC